MKILDFTHNEILNENIELRLDQFEQKEELEIYIKLWDANDSVLNIVINHLAKNTISRVKIRAIISDKAKLKINGIVKIAKNMSGSDTYFDAKILTMSEQAVGAITPSLEIDENDVKAGHSASITNISDRDLFYLTSRGMDNEAAKKLIMEGFLHQ